MRPLRCGLILLGVTLAGLLALAGAALNPGLQTWAARRWLAGHPQWHVSVERVAVEMGRWRVRNLRLERGGAVLTVPALEAEMPVVDALLHRRYRIGQLVANDWTLDLTRAPSASAAGAPARTGRSSRGGSLIASARAETARHDPAAFAPVFHGLFGALTLPADLELDGLKGEGALLLPPAPGGRGPARAHLSVGGGGLAAGSVGHFTFSLAQLPASGGAAVNAVAIDGILEATLGSARAFTRLALRINAAAVGDKFPQGVRLSGELGAVRSPHGEAYTARLTRENKELAVLSANFTDDAPRLEGVWKLNLLDQDVSPFALGRELPLFALVGQGRLDTDSTLERMHVSGELNAMADRLSVLSPALASIGLVHLNADFDLTHRDRLLRIDHLRATLVGAQPILTVQALQAFAFNADTGELQVADAGRDLLSIQLQAVPLEWSQPFLPGLAVTGSPLRGDFIASAREGALFLHSRSPVAVVGLAVARSGRLWVQHVNVAVTASAGYTPQGWQVDVQGNTHSLGARPAAPLAADAAPSLTFSAKFGRLAGATQPVKVTGRFRVSLPALAAQPGLERLRLDLRGGALVGDFSAGLTGDRFLQAKATISGLVADPSFAPLRGATADSLPDISAEMRADVGRDGRVAFSVPLTFTRGSRKSDLTLEGTLTSLRPGASFEGQLASNRLVFDDLKLFAPFTAGALDASTGEPRRGGDRAPAPAWTAGMGHLTLALKRIEGASWTMTDLKGAVGATAAALWLDHVHAGLTDGSEFKVDGGLTFAAGASEPYALQADLAMEHFDPAPIFRALNPDEPPTIEGRCDLTGHFTGRGASLGLLMAQTRGEFGLTSRGGILRALRTSLVESIQQAPSKLSEAVDSVVSLFGKSNSAQPFIDKQGQVVIKITDAFKEIHYDQLRVTAQRGADLTIRLTEFSVISPEIRVGGSGRITHQAGVPIPAQPLDLTIVIGARGRVADLMNGVGLLNGRPDGLGYTGLVEPIHLAGSLDDVDATEWKDVLVKAALRKAAGGLINKLLGK